MEARFCSLVLGENSATVRPAILISVLEADATELNLAREGDGGSEVGAGGKGILVEDLLPSSLDSKLSLRRLSPRSEVGDS
jgi:hypothetical protein